MVESTSTLTLYWSLGSQPSRAVATLLAFGNVEYTPVHKNTLAGETRTEEFLAINPAGSVPFIVDGDFKLGESNAILQYLAESRDSVPDHLWPKDAHKRAQVDQYLEWYATAFRPATVQPLRTKLVNVLKGVEIGEGVLTL
jgi:glutathione S-transferase